MPAPVANTSFARGVIWTIPNFPGIAVGHEQIGKEPFWPTHIVRILHACTHVYGRLVCRSFITSLVSFLVVTCDEGCKDV